MHQTLLQLDKPLPQFPYQLCRVLRTWEFNAHIADLQGNDLVHVIDYLDRAPSFR